MDVVEIEIKNWDKYNPKRDQKTYTWLRLNNNLATDPDLFGLDAEQKLFWVCLLCQASQKNSSRIEVDIGYYGHSLGIKPTKLHRALDLLSRKRIIAVITAEHDRARPDEVVDTTPTYVRTYETNERDERTDEATAPGADADLTPKNLFALWNSLRGPLPAAQHLSDPRRDKARAQLAKYPDRGHWVQAIERFTSSRFCREEWRPGFDDLLNEVKRLKALEGGYDDKPNRRDRSHAQEVSDQNMQQAQAILEGRA